MFSTNQLKLLEIISDSARRHNVHVYLIGGAVRDLLLGQGMLDRDLDLIVEGDAIDFAKKCLSELDGGLKTFPDFLTAKILSPSAFPDIGEIDFASTREEIYRKPGSLPQVKLAQTIAQDLKRRDFSINAMALAIAEVLHSSAQLASLREKVTDHFGGLADLDRRLIRVLHAGSFIDDPTRIFRACRYAVRLGGKVESGTAELLKQAVAVQALHTISDFRKLTELRKIAIEVRSYECLQLLRSYEVFAHAALFDEKNSDQVFSALERISKISLKPNEELLFMVWIELFVNYSKHAHDVRIVSGLNWRKSRIQQIYNDIDNAKAAVDGRDSMSLSDSALLLAMAMDFADTRRQKLLKLMRDRKLLTNEASSVVA